MGVKMVKFCLIFFLGGSLLYAVHRHFMGSSMPVLSLNFCYTFNFALSFLLMALLFLIRKTAKDQLGFIFLISGFLKIGAFLLCLKYLGLELKKELLPLFFIPYVYCLIAEVWLSTTLLKANNQKNVNNLE